MRLAVLVVVSVVLSACAGGTAAPASSAPSALGTIVISNPNITGEIRTPTAGPSQAVAPEQRASQPGVVGPISFQTQTSSPTPPFDVRDVAHDPRFAEPQPSESGRTNPAPGGAAAIALSNAPPGAPTPVPTIPSPEGQAAPTPAAPEQLLGSGQSMTVNLPAGTTTCNTSQMFTFNYPGDNSTVTIDAQLTGLDPSNAGEAGLNVWDTSSSTAPVAKATTLTNQKNSVPGSIELNYARPISGQVTIELYNWAGVNLTGTVTALSLASNGAPLQAGSVRASC